MKGKKIVVAIVAICLIATMCLTLVACDDNAQPDKKAIIYVTALFAGGLYDKETNTAVWEPFQTEIDAWGVMNGTISFDEVLEIFADEVPAIVKLALKAISYSEGSLLWDLTLDPDGVGYNPNIVPANGLPKDNNGKVMDISYGAFGLYKPFVDNISAKYGNEYDVMIYNQDWRMSPAKSAKELEDFINSSGYTEVILMSHSMGAPVVNNYLARSEANRNKVKLYMGFAPATLGSFDALAALACPDVYVNNFLGGMDTSSLPFDVNTVVDDFVSGYLGDFFRNNIGLMSLVPSWQLVDSDQYDENHHAITIDGKPIESKEELYDFYKSMRWAKYLIPRTQDEIDESEDGALYSRVIANTAAGHYADEDGYRIKDFAATLDSYFDNLFVNGKIASESVNSYYFLGTGNQSTITSIELTTQRDANGNPIYDDYGCVKYTYKLVTGGEGNVGDGTVPYYSSIGGNTATPEFIKGLGERYITFAGENHGTVGISWDLLGDYVMDLLERFA